MTKIFESMKSKIGNRPSYRTIRTLALLFAATLTASSADAAVHYQRLRSFGYPDMAGAGPDGVIEGSDGMLYGSANKRIFTVGKDGGGYRTLHQFDDSTSDQLVESP